MDHNGYIFKNNLKKEKLLLQLKKELVHLEFLTNHYRLVQIQKKVIKNFKIIGKSLEYFIPYFLVIAILTGACKMATSSFPIYLDDTKKFSKTIKEFDFQGLSKITTTYEETNINSNILVYTTSWQKENNSFTRETRIYNLNILTEENIISLLKNPYMNFEDLLGKPLKVTKDYALTLDNKSLNEKPNLKAYLYQEDLNDYIVLKEDENYNLLISIVYIIITLGVTSATYFLLSAKPEYNIVSDIQKIRQENSLNKDDLIKILELKKKNYERLRGDKDEHIER